MPYPFVVDYNQKLKISHLFEITLRIYYNRLEGSFFFNIGSYPLGSGGVEEFCFLIGSYPLGSGGVILFNSSIIVLFYLF